MRTVTLTTANTSIYAPPESENIQVAIDSATAAPYYYDAGFSIPFTLTNTNPISAPSLSNQTVNVSFNTAITRDVVSGAGNSPDPSTLVVLSGPLHGAASVSSGTITYAPSPGYVGSDSVTYQLCSSFDTTICSTANLSFLVAGPADPASVRTPDTGSGTPGSTLPLLLLLTASGFITGGVILFRKNMKNS